MTDLGGRKLLFFFGMGCSLLWAADQDHSSSSLPRQKVQKRDNRKGSLKSKAAQRAIPLVGRCSVVVSATHPIQEPCANAILTLLDKNGKEVFKTRTTLAGEFEFLIERGKDYHLVSGSRYYEVVFPQRWVRAGDQIDLKMVLK